MGASGPSWDSPYGCVDVAGIVLELTSDWCRGDCSARSNVT